MPRNSIQVGPRVSGGGSTPSQPHIADVTGLIADDPVPVDVDGVIKAKIVFHYTSPAVLGTGDRNFSGVVPRLQTPAKLIDFDAFSFSGAAAETVDLELLADWPAADEEWVLYVPSKSDTYTNPVVLKGKTGATPNVTLLTNSGPLDMDAPNVLAFQAGTVNQTTGEWSHTMRWDPLKTKMLVDWGCLLPTDRLNWSAVALFIQLASGEYVQASDLITEEDFTESESGPVYFGCIAIEGTDTPAVPAEWRFIACSYDRDVDPNSDGDGDPLGPIVKLNTLAPQKKPITDDGNVDLTTVIGQMPVSNISNIGSINITAFTGNLPISRVDNIGSINITTFTGNLPISRVDNIGTINISTFTGNLDFTRVANLAQFGIGNFEGVLLTQQLADGIMSDLNKYAKDFRPITKVSALPTLPNAAYPADTVVLRTSDSTLWKNNAGTWTAVSASDTITGKIADGDILSINCGKLVGQINAANVTTIRVDQLVGSLSVTQCNALTISNFTGNLDMSRINNLTNLSIASLQGNLDVSRVSNITTLYISSLQGNIDASRVANLGTINITTFTGNLDASRVNNITNLSIASFQGNLDVSRVSNIGTLSINTFSGTINTLNATTVTLTGQWGDGHISALNVSKLVAGTMQVGSGGLLFTGSGGISIGGTGSINVLAGKITAVSGAEFLSAGSGWTIIPGQFGYITGPGYINASAYRCNGVGGQTQNHDFYDFYGNLHTLTFNGGLLTNWITT